MTTDSAPAAEEANLFLGEAWFDPTLAGIRDQIRGFIEGLIEDELATAPGPGLADRLRKSGCRLNSQDWMSLDTCRCWGGQDRS